jgi:hypothetical protein
MKYCTNHWHTISTKEQGLFFKFIIYTKSKRENNLKPCDKTVQFSAGLHCHAIVKGIGKKKFDFSKQ